MKNMMYRDAVREALDEEMARDDTVFNMGEDVGFLGGNFKCTEGLMDKYGDLRCKDTPISEQGFVGMGVGAALRGLRPVIELMFGDFMMVCMDQICNQMAKITYMSGGQVSVPMVIRMPIGGWTFFRSTAFPVFPCMGCSLSGYESCCSVHSSRGKRFIENSNPRQQPGCIFRA